MIYIVTGGRSSGKTEYLKKIAKEKKCYGFISEKQFDNQQLCGYNLNSIDDIFSYEFAKTRKVFDKNKRFNFNLDCIKVIEKNFYDNIDFFDCFVLDEIGQLELNESKGFFKILTFLINSKKDFYISLNTKNLEDFKIFLEQFEFIPKYEIIKLKSLSAIILASGNSKRFGSENKLLTKINNETIFEKVLNTCVNSDIFSEIIVVTQFEEIKSICENYYVDVFENTQPNLGISKSISVGVEHSKNFIDGYMFLQADQPFITIETLQKLNGAFKNNFNDIIIPTYKKKKLSPKIFPSKYKSDLLNLKGDIGGSQILKNYSNNIFYVEFFSEKEFFDIDFKEDLNICSK